MRKLVSLSLIAVALCSGNALASSLLVDRGLPTANLNNAAGANRSNVSWTEGGGTATQYWVDGDSFTNNSLQTWVIDKIRMWTVEPSMTSSSLWGGLDGSTMGIISNSGVIQSTAYSGGATYQGSSGRYYDIQQVDFNVNIMLGAGQTFDFFLTGSPSDYMAPFSHASNAALSGSPQDGSDGLILWAEINQGVMTVGGTWDSNGWGWDKSSDINVQVFGNAVPEPASLALLSLAVVGLGFSRRRKS